MINVCLGHLDDKFLPKSMSMTPLSKSDVTTVLMLGTMGEFFLMTMPVGPK